MTEYPKAQRIQLVIGGECHRLVLRKEEGNCEDCSMRPRFGFCFPVSPCLALKAIADPDGLWKNAYFVRERNPDKEKDGCEDREAPEAPCDRETCP